MKQYRIGIAFGAFDPLHYGHIKLFERAKKQCIELIVCVSSESYILEHKGRSERVPLTERIAALDAVKHIDHVAIQGKGEFSKQEAVSHFKADAIFVGDDWTPETFTGEGLGVPVVYLPYTEGMSSTQLTQKMKCECNPMYSDCSKLHRGCTGNCNEPPPCDADDCIHKE